MQKQKSLIFKWKTKLNFCHDPSIKNRMKKLWAFFWERVQNSFAGKIFFFSVITLIYHLLLKEESGTKYLKYFSEVLNTFQIDVVTAFTLKSPYDVCNSKILIQTMHNNILHCKWLYRFTIHPILCRLLL